MMRFTYHDSMITRANARHEHPGIGLVEPACMVQILTDFAGFAIVPDGSVKTIAYFVGAPFEG